MTLGYLFLGDDAPTCLGAADSDDSGSVELTDAIFTLGYLFLGGPAPPAPFPACGADPTPDGLGCLSFAACGLRVVSDEGGSSIAIPDGAVDPGVEITVRTLAGGVVPGCAVPANGAAEFGPAGTVFAVPVTITIPCRVPLPPGAQFRLLRHDPEARLWEETEFVATVSADGLSFSADVTHFTTFGGTHGGSIFDDFPARFQDCSGPGASVEDLFWEMVDSFIREVWHPWQMVIGSDGLCYEVDSIEFSLDYASACGDDEGTLGALAGNEPGGDEHVSYRTVSPAVPGREWFYTFEVTVHLVCRDPRLIVIADKKQLKLDEETQVSLMRCNCGLDPVLTREGETAVFTVDGPGEVDPFEDALAPGAPRAKTMYRPADFGKATVRANVFYACGSEPEPRAVYDEVEIEVIAKGSIEYRHDLTVTAEGTSVTEHVRGSVPFAVAGGGVVGGGDVRTTGGGQVGDCSETVTGSALVIVTGEPLSDGSRGLSLLLNESWTKTLVFTCEGQTFEQTVNAPAVLHPIDVVYEEGFAYEQPFIGQGGSGTYRWIVHVEE